MKKKAIIVDLDGTLCDTKHRQHHMEQKPKNWKAFYGGISKDKPNEWCLELIRAMSDYVTIFFVSGRPDDYRPQTIEWLKKWVTPSEFEAQILLMRKSGDFRQDAIIKTEIYRQHIETDFDVLFCVDDRQQVVDAWRELGLTCLQCAKGDF